MNLKLLEDMSMDVDEIEIQYHPDNEKEVKDLKKFLEFETSTLEVVDDNHDIQEIRYAMIYSICFQNHKVIIEGNNKSYLYSGSFEDLKEKLTGDYFALINDDTMINVYHVKTISEDEPIRIVLENKKIYICTNLLELKKMIVKN